MVGSASDIVVPCKDHTLQDQIFCCASLYKKKKTTKKTKSNQTPVFLNSTVVLFLSIHRGQEKSYRFCECSQIEYHSSQCHSDPSILSDCLSLLELMPQTSVFVAI
jgi:hypothetical protein